MKEYKAMTYEQLVETCESYDFVCTLKSNVTMQHSARKWYGLEFVNIVKFDLENDVELFAVVKEEITEIVLAHTLFSKIAAALERSDFENGEFTLVKLFDNEAAANDYVFSRYSHVDIKNYLASKLNFKNTEV